MTNPESAAASTTPGASPAAGASPTPGAQPLLQLREVHKHFGGVAAVDGVTLEVATGEVAGLIGPNGAGKTTLVNVVTGLLVPDSGEILLAGDQVGALRAHQLAARGVARTFQTVRLYRSLTVLENVLGGMHLHRRAGGWLQVLPSRRPRAADKGRQDQAHGLLTQVGLDPDAFARRLAGTLSYGDQRRLEIARALAQRPRLLLLDEPAAGLNPNEKRQLGDLLRRLQAGGLTMVLIDHDLDLVLRVCDQVTVLNFGRRIAAGTPAEVRSDPAVITAYLGTGASSEPSAALPIAPAAVGTDHPIDPETGPATSPRTGPAPLAHAVAPPDSATRGRPDPKLVVDHLAVAYGPVVAVSDVSVEVGEGEIVSLIGANGAGKSTVLNTLSGLLRPFSGAARFGAIDLTVARPDAIVRSGLIHVPEGREILARLTVEENLQLGGWARRDGENARQSLEEMMDRFPILGTRRRVPAGQLSGGEQQMLAIARGLLGRPKLLVLDEPSLGLAPRAAEEVFTLIASIRDQGIPVLLVEQNARRALELADFAYVVENGRTVLAGTGRDLSDDPSVRRAYVGSA